MSAAERHDLAGAYALHALPDVERARYEHHLASCETCRAQVTDFLEVAAALGVAVQRTPPAGLRERVLAAVAGREPSRAPQVVRTGVPRWAPVAAALVAAALAAVVTLAGVRAFEGPALDERVAAVLAAGDLEVSALEGEGDEVGANVAVAPSTGDAVLLLRSLEPGEGTYTLWTVRDGAPFYQQPLDAPDGDVMVLLVPDIGGAAAMAVSLEPDAERKPAPEGPILAQAALPGG
jgi:hypothetical protein